MTTALHLAAGIAFALVLTSLFYYLAATLAALRFERTARRPAPPLPKVAPRVAVLKPLHGASATLADSLISYLESDYSRAEYYFAVSDYEDPAAAIPAALRAQYQFAPLTLIVGEEPGCANRKVGKLIRMAARAANAEIFVMSDADIAVTRDHLRRVAAELAADDQTGIVTCIYRARPVGSLASRLEALCVNTDFAPMVMVSAACEPIHYALGATIAIKRTVLEKIGGFHRLKDLLADDYYLGKFVTEAGYKIRLSRSVVTTHCAERRFADFWHHQLRWARTYRTTRPVSLATIILHGPFWALLFLLVSGLSLLGWVGLCAVLVARIAMARILVGRVLGLGDLRRDTWLVPLKDLVMTGIWFASLMSNTVEWGGRRFEILPGGAMRDAHD